MLLPQRIWYHYEEKLDLLPLGLFLALWWWLLHVLSEVSVNGVFKVFNSRLVMERHDITIVHEDVKVVFLWKLIEFVLKVLGVLDVFFETKNGPWREVNRLTHYWTKNVGIIKRLKSSHLVPRIDRRLFKNFSFNFIRLKWNLKVPFSNFLRLSYHFIDFFDALDSVLRLLEEALTDISHNSLVLSNLWWYTDKNTQLRRKVDVLPLLFDLEERLVKLMNFCLISF